MREVNPAEGKGRVYIINLESYPSTVLTLFVLTTLDNYPDVLYGIVSEKPELQIFFFIFAIISGIIMMSIMTGVFYSNFKDLYSENVDKLINEKKEYKR